MIIGCSQGKHLAKKIARILKQPYSELRTRVFPDGESYVKLQTKVKGKHLILVQSFSGQVNDCVMEVLFAAYTARKLGAKTITLAASYFPYLRQDKRFHDGETISIEVAARLVNLHFDKLLILDPHLHRKESLSSLFNIPVTKVNSNDVIAKYIKNHLPHGSLIGPDWESYKWAQQIAEQLGRDCHILHKKRWSARKVKIYFAKNIHLGKKAIIVDDIISSGNTLLETIKGLKKRKVKDITCIAIHGIFAENALEKLRKTGAKVITTNSIPNKTGKIDISKVIAGGLKKKK